MKIQNLGSSIVIQGASGGLGLAITTAALKSPHINNVFATFRRPSDALMSLFDTHPTHLTLLEMDMTCDVQIAKTSARIQQATNHVDLLINCAGLLHDQTKHVVPEKRLENLNRHALEQCFAVNTTGPLLFTQALLPLLLRSSHPRIANVSAKVGSISDNHLGGWYAYRASKAAQNMLTKCLSIDLSRRHKNIAVVALHLGTIDTSMSRPFQQNVKHQIFTPDQAAGYLLNIIAELSSADNGQFFSWNGDMIDW